MRKSNIQCGIRNAAERRQFEVESDLWLNTDWLERELRDRLTRARFNWSAESVEVFSGSVPFGTKGPVEVGADNADVQIIRVTYAPFFVVGDDDGLDLTVDRILEELNAIEHDIEGALKARHLLDGVLPGRPMPKTPRPERPKPGCVF